MERTDLILWIECITGLCVVSFLIGLATWSRLCKRKNLEYWRDIRNILILFAIISSVFVALGGLWSFPLTDSKSELYAESRASLFLGPAAVAGILFTQILALHLRLLGLGRKHP